MEKQGLERSVELEYLHYDSRGIHFPDEAGVRAAGEAVVAIDGKRVIYFWNTLPTGELFNVVVPGALVREKHRKDASGNVYSTVTPLDEGLKPALERTIWFELIILSGRFLSEAVKFSYLSATSPD